MADSTPPPIKRGPFMAPRDPKSYPSARKALLPERQQDWEYAKAQYETGTKSVQLIAAEIGVGPTAVYARISNHGWTKNTEARTQHLTALKVAHEIEKEKKLELEEERAVRVNAEMQARTLVTHRADIQRARALTMRLFKELEDLMDNLPDLQDLGELLRSENDRGQDRRNAVYRAVIDMPSRVDAVKKLSEAMKTQIQLERQAHGIVGALEDPETPQAPHVGQSDMDKILGKFNLVLQAKTPVSGPTLGEVVDVQPTNS
jgi:hypothetical protein